MERKLLVTTAALFLGIITVFGQLFPKVTKPTSPEMSMLIVQFAHDEGDKISSVANTNFSGWAPVVKGPDGSIIPFRNYDAGANITNIFYAENLVAGTYTLVGFYHVYTDYSLLDAYEKEVEKAIIASYGPFENYPYHVKQIIPLKEPVTISLEPNKIMSLGSYAVKYRWVGGMGGTTDDRWKVVEDETSITQADPKSDTLLRYIKPWATPAWKKWNVKNPATPL